MLFHQEVQSFSTFRFFTPAAAVKSFATVSYIRWMATYDDECSLDNEERCDFIPSM